MKPWDSYVLKVKYKKQINRTKQTKTGRKGHNLWIQVVPFVCFGIHFPDVFHLDSKLRLEKVNKLLFK